jgi:hypothetical protein
LSQVPGDSRRRLRRLLLVATLGGAALAAAPAIAPANLTTNNNTPFPASKVIVGVRWTSPRYSPPRNQAGDILPTTWADDGNLYVLMDDGGTDVPRSGALWRHSFARITGSPPHLRFQHVGNPFVPPPHTWAEIQNDPGVWRGPLGPYYSNGFAAIDHVFYATQALNWNWAANAQYQGLAGIAYSTDHGQTWKFPAQQFGAPLGNLDWVARGRDGPHPDGYAYAIASEREFNASKLILGRSLTDVGSITDPSHWQWVTGWQEVNGKRFPVWSSSLAAATPVASWTNHITYPQMAYDAPLGRYLLSFTYSYGVNPPAAWQNGAEFVILESKHPWGPFSFVARAGYFGPSNGYGAGFPLKWISPDGRDLWLKWAANFDGCKPGLDCSGAYGFNYRRLHLTAFRAR